jgi:hypothetical protein
MIAAAALPGTIGIQLPAFQDMKHTHSISEAEAFHRQRD